MRNNYILFFDEIDKKDVSLVGGKGANLGEMTKAGFQVPYGFCVTTEAYRDFMQYNKLLDFITEVIKDANLKNISQVGKKIREKIEKSEIPGAIAFEILSAVHKIGTANYFAVRSSATAEDSAFASFAGQQDTYLNINGENQYFYMLETVGHLYLRIDLTATIIRSAIYGATYHLSTEERLTNNSIFLEKILTFIMAGLQAIPRK